MGLCGKRYSPSGRNCAGGQAMTRFTSPASLSNHSVLMCTVLNCHLCLHNVSAWDKWSIKLGTRSTSQLHRNMGYSPGRFNPKCCRVLTTEQTQEVPWDSEEYTWLCLEKHHVWILPINIQFWHCRCIQTEIKMQFWKGKPSNLSLVELWGYPILVL